MAKQAYAACLIYRLRRCLAGAGDTGSRKRGFSYFAVPVAPHTTAMPPDLIARNVRFVVLRGSCGLERIFRTAGQRSNSHLGALWKNGKPFWSVAAWQDLKMPKALASQCSWFAQAYVPAPSIKPGCPKTAARFRRVPAQSCTGNTPSSRRPERGLRCHAARPCNLPAAPRGRGFGRASAPCHPICCSPARAVITDGRMPKLVRIDRPHGGQVPDCLSATTGTARRRRLPAISYIPGEAFTIRVQGGTVRVAYMPESGSSTSVNGPAAAARSGGDLVNAMFWLRVGPNPVPGNLRHLLMRGTC